MTDCKLTIDQGAALMWLRKVGGLAGCNRAGDVSFQGTLCPLTFINFEALERLGMVEARLPDKASEHRLDVLMTDAGAKHPIEPSAERRLDELLRRFDD